MAIKLSNGQNFELIHDNLFLTVMNIEFGLTEGQDIELDASAFLLNADGKLESDEDVVSVDNPVHKSGSIEYSDRKFSFDGYVFKECRLFLLHVPTNVESIAFAMKIRDAEAHNLNFGKISGAHIRLEDDYSGREILRCELDELCSSATSVIIGQVYRTSDLYWSFRMSVDGFEERHFYS